MVAQVLAHPRQIVHYWDTQTTQRLRRTDPGEHQDLRRTDGPAAQDYLLPLRRELFASAFHLDAGNPVAVENQAVNGAVWADGQVEPVPAHVQVAQGGAPADAVGVVYRAGTDSSGIGQVVVGAIAEIRVTAGVVKCLLLDEHLVGFETPQDDGPVRVVEVPAAEVGIRLDHPEILEQVLKAPLVVAHGRPGVVVFGNAPEEHLAVDGAGAAGHLTPGHQHLFGGVRGLTGKLPIVVADHDVGGGSVAVLDLIGKLLEIGVIRSRFEQQHRAVGVLAEARGHDGPCGTRSDYYMVVLHPWTLRITIPDCPSLDIIREPIGSQMNVLRYYGFSCPGRTPPEDENPPQSPFVKGGQKGDLSPTPRLCRVLTAYFQSRPWGTRPGPTRAGPSRATGKERVP